jgi:hypothetical protein
VTVNLADNTLSNYNGPSPYTDSVGNKYYGYYLTGTTPNTWTLSNVNLVQGNGLGVNTAQNGSPGNIDNLVSFNEYMIIDFGANYINKSNFALKLVDLFSPSNFTYYWSSTMINSGDTTPTAGTVDVNSTLTTGSFQPLTGGDRYLVLGATNNSAFAIAGVQYDQVPDGSLTVVLLGAALGGFGLVASRRRRA